MYISKIRSILGTLFIGQIIFLSLLYADSTEVEVTFISNAGFMISSGGKSIILDGMGTPGYYLSSDEELANHEKIINM